MVFSLYKHLLIRKCIQLDLKEAIDNRKIYSCCCSRLLKKEGCDVINFNHVHQHINIEKK